MRSLHLMPPIASIALLALGGCLVSETAILDERSGRARPLPDGIYLACPVDDAAGDGDCDRLSVRFQSDRSYRFESDDGPSVLRFRRIARRAYAMQSREGENEFAYYYAAGGADRLSLTMMMCADLPDKLRGSLLEAGDLETDSDDFELCSVKAVRGLVRAAMAYHRGETAGVDAIKVELTPAPKE